MISVTIEPHLGVHLVTHEVTRLAQDRVFADGRFIGYLSHATPPVFSLVRAASPAEIVAAVEKIKESTEYPPKVISPAPNIPPELLKKNDEDEDDDE